MPEPLPDGRSVNPALLLQFRVPDRGSGNPTPLGGMGLGSCASAAGASTCRPAAATSPTRSGPRTARPNAIGRNDAHDALNASSPESAGGRTDPALSRNLKPPPFRRWSIHASWSGPLNSCADCPFRSLRRRTNVTRHRQGVTPSAPCENART